MLVFSLIGPTVGTGKIDIFQCHNFDASWGKAIDTLWRLDQNLVNLTQPNWRLLKISRCKVANNSHWLHWIGLYSPSPISPDGRQGYYIGVGLCIDTFLASVPPLHNILNKALNNYENFVKRYRDAPEGFLLSSMRLDRINLSKDDIENIQACEQLYQPKIEAIPPSSPNRILLPNTDISTPSTFRKVYQESQNIDSLTKYSEILATPSYTLLFDSKSSTNNYRSNQTDYPSLIHPESNSNRDCRTQVRTPTNDTPHTFEPKIENRHISSMLKDIHSGITLLQQSSKTSDRNISLHNSKIEHYYVAQRRSTLSIITLLILLIIATFLKPNIYSLKDIDSMSDLTAQPKKYPVDKYTLSAPENSNLFYEKPKQFISHPSIEMLPQNKEENISVTTSSGDKNQQHGSSPNVRNQFNVESSPQNNQDTLGIGVTTWDDRDQNPERVQNDQKKLNADYTAPKRPEPSISIPPTGVDERQLSTPTKTGITSSVSAINCQNPSTISTLRQLKTLTSQVTDTALSAYLSLLGDLCPSKATSDQRTAPQKIEKGPNKYSLKNGR